MDKVPRVMSSQVEIPSVPGGQNREDNVKTVTVEVQEPGT